jgi:hypothetical protein
MASGPTYKGTASYPRDYVSHRMSNSDMLLRYAVVVTYFNAATL